MIESPKAFVIMPFDLEFYSIYEDLIKPALEDAGYDVARADSSLDQQNILHDIVRGIANAKLIVADLTTINPNVLYELGLCHGLQIPTILLAQSMDEVPFDLRSYRIVIYSIRFDQVYKLKQDLKEIAEKHKIGGITFRSPITDFLSFEQRLQRSDKSIESIYKPTEGLTEEVEEEKGFLDLIVEANEAAEEISNIFLSITNETYNIGNKLQSHTVRINDIAAIKGPGTAVQFHKISLLVASDMNDYSEKIEKITPGFEKNIDILIESSSKYISWIEPRTEEERKAVIEMREALDKLLEVTKASLESIRQYSQSVAHLRGISREVNRASRRLTLAIDAVIMSMEKIEAFCARVLPLIDEKLSNRL